MINTNKIKKSKTKTAQRYRLSKRSPQCAAGSHVSKCGETCKICSNSFQHASISMTQTKAMHHCNKNGSSSCEANCSFSVVTWRGAKCRSTQQARVAVWHNQFFKEKLWSPAQESPRLNPEPGAHQKSPFSLFSPKSPPPDQVQFQNAITLIT